jgi:hypothetical protein
MMHMESINFEETGGAFGIKRVLGTFELVTAPNGCVMVLDSYQNNKAVGFGFSSAQAAVNAYKAKDDYRLVSK